MNKHKIESVNRYIYGGIVDLENSETRFIYDLMLAADEFELEELTNKLETLLIETKEFCNYIVAKYPHLIFESDYFTSLEESVLVSLIKRNDLQIEEIKIWDYVIKWGIAQTSTLPTNLDDWITEKFFILKTTLQQCLPHIRYFHLSSAEIVDKIKPYKKILKKQLWGDIKLHLMVPDRPIESTILPPRSVLVTELHPRAEEPEESFSTIISEEHAAEISTWIDHGFAPQTFWNTCHGHVGTVVLVKIKGTDEIIGGYNPVAWDKNTYVKTANTQYAVFYRSEDDQIKGGPHFGDFWMYSKKSDFTLDDSCFCRSYGNDYEKLIRSSSSSSSSSSYFPIINYEQSKNREHPICRGPHFGDFWMYSKKSDFTLDDSCFCRSYGNDYEKLIRSSSSSSSSSSYFPIINYEVFKIVRKII
ncbi:hypothetical protein Glove_177g153 [Diversispora epigaea]|uniref:TLDc domain-containing protein n=1 Tax=Diversispora epigaea TaxID=1348612 RepID=A0A397IWK6_9GLOM|nr:hypothetical protein Glove_177g153 [Diversispora epigaea]